MLKLKFLPHLSVLCTRDACVESVDNNHRQSVNFEGTEEEEVYLSELTYVIDALSPRILLYQVQNCSLFVIWITILFWLHLSGEILSLLVS